MRAKVLTFKRARRLRREMTAPEVVLWDVLRGGRLGGLRFRRQHPIGSYILDFFCPVAKLAVEVDGEGHANPEQARRDDARSRWLNERGIRVLRLPATAIMNVDEREGAVTAILAAANST